MDNYSVLRSKFLIGMFSAVLLTSLMCGCISSGGSEADITYGGQFYPEEFVLLGYGELWDEQGLNVDHILFSSGAEGNEAIIAGRVDINAGSDSKTIALFNAIPDDALILATVQSGNRYTTIVREGSGYENWDDLVGKTVAVRSGTGAESVLRKYFDMEGYHWEDFNWVNLMVENMIAALQSGQIEAFTAWEPTPAIAESQGIGVFMMSYGDVSSSPVILHTTKGFAEGHRDEIVSFLAVHIKKANLIHNSPAEAANKASQAALAIGIEVSPDAFIKIFERIDFSVAINDDIIASIYETAEFLFQEGKIGSIPTLVYDSSYLEEAETLVQSQV